MSLTKQLVERVRS